MSPPPSVIILLIVVSAVIAVRPTSGHSVRVAVRSPLFAILMPTQTTKHGASQRSQAREDRVSDDCSTAGAQESRHAALLLLRRLGSLVVMVVVVPPPASIPASAARAGYISIRTITWVVTWSRRWPSVWVAVDLRHHWLRRRAIREGVALLCWWLLWVWLLWVERPLRLWLRREVHVMLVRCVAILLRVAAALWGVVGMNRRPALRRRLAVTQRAAVLVLEETVRRWSVGEGVGKWAQALLRWWWWLLGSRCLLRWRLRHATAATWVVVIRRRHVICRACSC